MLEKFYPDIEFEKATDVRPDFLSGRGIRGVILDIDNTILEDGGDCPGTDVREWLKILRDNGIRVFLLSNTNNGERFRALCATLEAAGMHKAGKPSARGFRMALEALGTGPGQTALIGDQIFTDVWGARKAGVYAVLVKPIHPRENAFVRFKRFFERPVLDRYRKSLTAPRR